MPTCYKKILPSGTYIKPRGIEYITAPGKDNNSLYHWTKSSFKFEYNGQQNVLSIQSSRRGSINFVCEAFLVLVSWPYKLTTFYL